MPNGNFANIGTGNGTAGTLATFYDQTSSGQVSTDSGGSYASAVATANSTNPGLYTVTYAGNEVSNWNVSYSTTSYLDYQYSFRGTTANDPYIRVQNTSAGSLPLDANNPGSSNWFGFNPGTLNSLPFNSSLLSAGPGSGTAYGVGVYGSWVNNYVSNGSFRTAYANPPLDVNSDNVTGGVPSALDSVSLTSAASLATIVGGYTYTASVDVGNFSGRNSPAYTIGFYDGTNPNPVGTTSYGYGNVTATKWTNYSTSWMAPPGAMAIR